MKIVFRRALAKKSRFSILRFWRFFALRRGMHKHDHALFIELYVGRLLAMLGLLAGAAYIAAVIALTLFWGNRPHSPVTAWDVAWPGNWSSIHPKLGQMQIKQAEEYLEQGKGTEAFHTLRAGLRMYPQDSDARLTLALLFASAQMYSQAASVLEEGLRYGIPENKEYTRVLFQLMRIEGNHPMMTRVIPVFLEDGHYADQPKVRYALMRQLMIAQLLDEDFIGLMETAEAINDDPDAPYKAYDMAVAAMLGSGSEDDALVYLQALPGDIRAKPSIMLLEASVYHRVKDDAAMMAILQPLFRNYPHAYREQIQAIKLMLTSGRNQRAGAYIDLFLKNHAHHFKAIDSLAMLLTDLPDSERLQSVIDFVVRGNPAYRPKMEFYAVQALVTENRFMEAQATFEAAGLSNPAITEQDKHIRIFDLLLKALTNPGGQSRAVLLAALREGKWDGEVYWEAGRALYADGQRQAALDILNLALNAYPYNTALKGLRETVTNEEALAPPRNTDDLLQTYAEESPGDEEVDFTIHSNYPLELDPEDMKPEEETP